MSAISGSVMRSVQTQRHRPYAAMDDGLVGRNVAARIEPPQTRRTKPKILQPAELNALLDVLSDRYGVFVALGAYSSFEVV